MHEYILVGILDYIAVLAIFSRFFLPPNGQHLNYEQH